MTNEVEVEENDYTCGFCRHYKPDECYCQARGEFEVYSLDSCDEWEEDKDELTDDEKLMNKGDWEYHEMIEREGRIE